MTNRWQFSDKAKTYARGKVQTQRKTKRPPLARRSQTTVTSYVEATRCENEMLGHKVNESHTCKCCLEDIKLQCAYEKMEPNVMLKPF